LTSSEASGVFCHQRPIHSSPKLTKLWLNSVINLQLMAASLSPADLSDEQVLSTQFKEEGNAALALCRFNEVRTRHPSFEFILILCVDTSTRAPVCVTHSFTFISAWVTNTTPHTCNALIFTRQSPLYDPQRHPFVSIFTTRVLEMMSYTHTSCDLQCTRLKVACSPSSLSTNTSTSWKECRLLQRMRLNF
jgi:hypothetical protein